MSQMVAGWSQPGKAQWGRRVVAARAQVGGDGFGGGADVQRQADGGQWPAVEGRAEPGGESFWSG